MKERSQVLPVLRKLLLGVLVLGLLSLSAELMLLEHHEDWQQWIPLALLAIALLLLAAYGVTRSVLVLRVLRWTGVAFVISGLVGIYLHYRGNAEFEREMYPEMGGLELIWEALRGATPALAPGTMSQFGLLILIYLFRHPRLKRGETTE